MTPKKLFFYKVTIQLHTRIHTHTLTYLITKIKFAIIILGNECDKKYFHTSNILLAHNRKMFNGSQ